MSSQAKKKKTPKVYDVEEGEVTDKATAKRLAAEVRIKSTT
jgi:hypothetical protein